MSEEERKPQFEQYTEVVTHDVNGRPIANSRGEPFAEAVTATRFRRIRPEGEGGQKS